MKNSGLYIIVIILIIINIVTLSLLWKKGGPPPPFREDRAMKELNLAPGQLKKIRGLREEHRDQMMEVREKLFTARNALFQELFDDNPDSIKVISLSREIGNLQSELEIINYNHLISVKSILSEEQLPRFKKHILNQRIKMERQYR